MCARCLAENDVMEYMARSDMRGEIVHPYMFYTHMLCKRKAQFFSTRRIFLGHFAALQFQKHRAMVAALHIHQNLGLFDL